MRPLGIFLASILLTIATGAQVKMPVPPSVKVPFNKSLQAVVVTTKDWNTVTGTARIFERKDVNADWKPVGGGFPVVVGRNGLAWGDIDVKRTDNNVSKREGDGKAPAGFFPLTSSFGTASKPTAVELPYTKLDQYTECVDDVRSRFYNQIVNRMQVGNFDWKSSEKMLAVGEQYGLGVFVAYNTYPVEKGNGSCIFLHIWKDQNSGTSGCTAMERRNLERIVAWISPAKNPYLVQLPVDAYKNNRKAWHLPKV